MIKKLPLIISFSAILFAGGAAAQTPSLKKAFRKDFLIGTAMNTWQIEEKDTAADRIIKQQFNAVTPENCMKAEVIEPAWGNYNFDLADKLVAFAKKNNIKVNAHNLIWHSQLPPFMHHMQNADSVKQYFENHIAKVAGRYDGKVYSWDVVNEALNEDGTLRKDIFLDKLGDDYVVEAFRLAQKASPIRNYITTITTLSNQRKEPARLHSLKKYKPQVCVSMV